MQACFNSPGDKIEVGTQKGRGVLHGITWMRKSEPLVLVLSRSYEICEWFICLNIILTRGLLVKLLNRYSPAWRDACLSCGFRFVDCKEVLSTCGGKQIHFYRCYKFDFAIFFFLKDFQVLLAKVFTVKVNEAKIQAYFFLFFCQLSKERKKEKKLVNISNSVTKW